jgi:hypothetical protein
MRAAVISAPGDVQVATVDKSYADHRLTINQRE